MKNISPVYIDKAIKLTTGDVKDGRRMKDRTILIEAFSQTQADKLCKMTKLCKAMPMSTAPHFRRSKCAESVLSYVTTVLLLLSGARRIPLPSNIVKYLKFPAY